MNDNLPDEDFRVFLTRAFRAMAEPLKPGGAFYIWHGNTKANIFHACATAAGLEPREVLIWVKNHFAMGRQDYQWKHEPCFYGWKTGARHYFRDSRRESTVMEDEPPDFRHMLKAEMLKLLEDIYSDKAATTVIHEAKPNSSADHRTMKPIRLLAGLITNSSRPGETVLDPFGGSGSTLMACEQLGRRCLMMELDPHFCDVIIRRWETFTGRKAAKI